MSNLIFQRIGEKIRLNIIRRMQSQEIQMLIQKKKWKPKHCNYKQPRRFKMLMFGMCMQIKNNKKLNRKQSNYQMNTI